MHSPGVNDASGNAPALLTQIMWIGSLVTGIVLFLASKKAVAAGSRRWTVSALQAIVGLAIVGIASGFIIWTGRGRLEHLRFMGRRRGISGPAARFRI
ncbi:hypothetical protein [Cohnella cholangitidis]|uniref:hypothetical protein n=1 Tax=Cohnella cholangitidis TaxID=2598458 RepID=UPI001E3E5511|nr:hypothetical protein [Cohnella cholangitidis]